MANWMTPKGGQPGMGHKHLGVPPKSTIPVRLRRLSTALPSVLGPVKRRPILGAIPPPQKG